MIKKGLKTSGFSVLAVLGFSACGSHQTAQTETHFPISAQDIEKYVGNAQDFTALSLDENEVSISSAMAPSGGSGGRVGNYVTTVSNIEMKVYTPSAEVMQRGPVQLVIYLHGDTANGYFQEFFHTERRWANDRNMIFVAALAPNRDSWWRGTYQDQFAQALDFLKSRYNVHSDNILYSGVSGGSTFLTMNFMPKYGHRYPGTVVANCGGAAPRWHSELNRTLAIQRGLNMNFVYTDGDYLADPNGFYGAVIPASITAYRNSGIPTVARVLGGRLSHCNYNIPSETLRIWQDKVVPPRQTAPAPAPTPAPAVVRAEKTFSADDILALNRGAGTIYMAGTMKTFQAGKLSDGSLRPIYNLCVPGQVRNLSADYRMDIEMRVWVNTPTRFTRDSGIAIGHLGYFMTSTQTGLDFFGTVPRSQIVSGSWQTLKMSSVRKPRGQANEMCARIQLGPQLDGARYTIAQPLTNAWIQNVKVSVTQLP